MVEFRMAQWKEKRIGKSLQIFSVVFIGASILTLLLFCRPIDRHQFDFTDTRYEGSLTVQLGAAKTFEQRFCTVATMVLKYKHSVVNAKSLPEWCRKAVAASNCKQPDQIWMCMHIMLKDQYDDYCKYCY